MQRKEVINLNVNLHPSFFQQPVNPQRESRALDSVTFINRIPDDLTLAPRREYAFSKTQDDPCGDNTKHVLKNIHEDNYVAKVFFSDKNIRTLQGMIRSNVFVQTGGQFDSSGKPIRETGHIVGQQSKTELLIYMRYIYLTYARCYDKYSEVCKLNQLTVRETIPKIIQEVEAHLGYLRDASQMRIPEDRPLLDSIHGTKNLRPMTDTFGDFLHPRAY